MYKLIDANKYHATQILRFLSETCYWKEFVEGNLQNKSYEDFMLEWVVLPRIPITKVLVSDDDNTKILGCVIAATIEVIGAMPDYTPYLHPKVMEIFGSWFSYPVSDSIVLELYAVDKQIKKMGYGKKLLEYVDSLAQINKKDCISCFVWNCFADSVVTTTKSGFMTLDYLKFSDPIKFGLLYMEKRPQHSAIKDYFQSSDYVSTKNLLTEL